MAEIRSNESVLNEVLDLKGLKMADIGSGAGEMVRYMTRQGASVTGLECGELQLEKARSYPKVEEELTPYFPYSTKKKKRFAKPPSPGTPEI